MIRSIKLDRKLTRGITTSIGLVLATFNLACAGEVPTWTPAELFERADVIIVGQPTKIETTDERSSISFHGGKVVELRHHKAQVRIEHVIKGGDLDDDIIVTYSNQIDTTQAVSRIWLNEESLFILYLKRSKDGGYVGALEGEYHDGQAAKRLAKKQTEQVDAGQPATRPESKSEGGDKPQPDAEGRSR